MKRSVLAVLGFVLLLAACSSDSPTASSTSSSSASSSTSSSSASTSSSSSASTAAGPTLAIKELKSAMNTKVGTQILVTDTGLPVYMYKPDGTSETSTVEAGLKATWPAIVAVDPQNLILNGIDPSVFAVKTQPDGTKQLAYNGHLLYGFSGDSAPGDANGQALGGIWFVLSPGGDQIGS